MRKEAFKASILKQIDNPNSAIHLYLHPRFKDRKISKWGRDKITGLTVKCLYCSEFELRMDIKCSMDAFKNLVYTVLFNEMTDEEKQFKFDKFTDMTLLKNETIIYLKEHVNHSICSFDFCLIHYRLSMNDYLFKAEEGIRDVCICADVLSRKFLSFNLDIHRYTWDTLRENGGDIQYVHYMFTADKMRELTIFLKRQGINEDEINQVANIFSELPYSQTLTGLSLLVSDFVRVLGYTIS